MEIRQIINGKKKYIELLLLADEQEDMIERYLERGDMFVLEDDGIKAECVVTKEAEGVYEIKNIAVKKKSQGQGYGRALIEFVVQYYKDAKTFRVGTGDVPSTVGFYEKCGFVQAYRVKNFFLDNYDHEIVEDGKQLVDMVVLERGVEKHLH